MRVNGKLHLSSTYLLFYIAIKGVQGYAYEDVTLRQTSVTLPKIAVGDGVTLPPLAAQSGKLFRSNIATPYVFTQITNTVTARIFIPKPALA